MSNELDEINQIMNDIESLQKEMEETAQPSAIEPAAVHNLAGFRPDAAAAGSESLPMEETLSQITTDSIPESKLLNEPVQAVVTPILETPMKKAREEGQMTLSVSGSMSLKLKFESGDQEVTVSFEGDSLKVSCNDGAEFKIPVGSGIRKAA